MDSGRNRKINWSSSIGLENNLDIIHWMIGTMSLRKMFTNMEEVDCWIAITTVLHQKHFNHCIQNTIGCHGSLDIRPKDSGRNMRINWSSLIGLGNNLNIIHWMIGTMSPK